MEILDLHPVWSALRERKKEPLNYFGHAALAILHQRSDPFVLGAMLPDLTAMARVPNSRAQLGSPDLKEGWEFHLKTDEVFHKTQCFQVLNRAALQHFTSLKIRKGPARACAHIGIEMLIDAHLAEDERYHAPYVQALRWGAQREGDLGCPSPIDEKRLSALLEHLADKGPVVHSTSPSRLAFRLERTLYDRPKLNPTDAELQLMVQYLCDFRSMHRVVEELLTELRNSQL